jgi:hypothetical protein
VLGRDIRVEVPYLAAMAIPDPHAIPENEHDCQEYLHEGDAAWDAQNNDLAYDLYHALRQSQFVAHDADSHASYRLGLIAQTRGQVDLAVYYFSASNEPAATDALHALTNATTADPTPDPDRIPESAEQLDAWYQAGVQAAGAGDWHRAYGLFVAGTQSSAGSPPQLGLCYAQAAISALNLGDEESAVYFYEQAIPLMGASPELDQIRQRLSHLGGAQVGAAGTTPADTQTAAGINAYENGDAQGARTALEAALHLDGPNDQKARAHYYLGAMDYQTGHYADARNHVEAAVAGAPEPERSWAQAMLEWRWDEHPAAASTAPPATGSVTSAPTATPATGAAPAS